MTTDPIHSIDEVCEVLDFRGAESDAPNLLIELPHGATRAAHFDQLRSALHGDYPDDLKDFFFVNTDVGTPELAARLAERFVAASPTHRATVVRCLIPRTFIDCNRVIDRSARASASSSAVTPGLHIYVRDRRDRTLLLDRYDAYIDTVRRAYESVCGRGGLGLMLHSYAPRSIQVEVDDDIVTSLRSEYQPDKITTWPLRSEVDLIADTPTGERLGSTAFVDRALPKLSRCGIQGTVCGTYALHPGTLARVFAEQYPERTICLEVRRDLLVGEFTPFAEMSGEPAAVDRIADALLDPTISGIA